MCLPSSIGNPLSLNRLRSSLAFSSRPNVAAHPSALPSAGILRRMSRSRAKRSGRRTSGIRSAGPEARLVSRGTFALTGRQHADTHIEVRHLARDTACDIAWRGAADQRARGVFHGAITIEAGADGADAQLSNKNLLLSAQAEIDTQPVLVIHADEVKAAHGATVGQLDEQALFYLRTRGIPREAARRLLVTAFCGAMLDGIASEELRGHLGGLLALRLPQAEAA
jgi:Fe-S cluster assembly protein SufD